MTWLQREENTGDILCKSGHHVGCIFTKFYRNYTRAHSFSNTLRIIRKYWFNLLKEIISKPRQRLIFVGKTVWDLEILSLIRWKFSAIFIFMIDGSKLSHYQRSKITSMQLKLHITHGWNYVKCIVKVSIVCLMDGYFSVLDHEVKITIPVQVPTTVKVEAYWCFYFYGFIIRTSRQQSQLLSIWAHFIRNVLLCWPLAGFISSKVMHGLIY